MSLKDRLIKVKPQFAPVRPGETCWKVYHEDTVRVAVSRILNRIRCLPNRDDSINFSGPRLCLLDGGGVGKFEVLRIIEEEFGMTEETRNNDY